MARDWFAEAFGSAVEDIRKRLVEESWFGREVTPPVQANPLSQALGWEKEHLPTPDPEHGRDQEHDR